MYVCMYVCVRDYIFYLHVLMCKHIISDLKIIIRIKNGIYCTSYRFRKNY